MQIRPFGQISMCSFSPSAKLAYVSLCAWAFAKGASAAEAGGAGAAGAAGLAGAASAAGAAGAAAGAAGAAAAAATRSSDFDPRGSCCAERRQSRPK